MIEHLQGQLPRGGVACWLALLPGGWSFPLPPASVWVPCSCSSFVPVNTNPSTGVEHLAVVSNALLEVWIWSLAAAHCSSEDDGADAENYFRCAVCCVANEVSSCHVFVFGVILGNFQVSSSLFPGVQSVFCVYLTDSNSKAEH